MNTSTLPALLQGYLLGLKPIHTTLWEKRPDGRTREGKDWRLGFDLAQQHRRERGHEWAMGQLGQEKGK